MSESMSILISCGNDALAACCWQDGSTDRGLFMVKSLASKLWDVTSAPGLSDGSGENLVMACCEAFNYVSGATICSQDAPAYRKAYRNGALGRRRRKAPGPDVGAISITRETMAAHIDNSRLFANMDIHARTVDVSALFSEEDDEGYIGSGIELEGGREIWKMECGAASFSRDIDKLISAGDVFRIGTYAWRKIR